MKEKKLKMITMNDIRARIEPLGFYWTKKHGFGDTRRYEGPTIHQLAGIRQSAGQSSLYIKDNYISATGHYRNLEELVPPSCHDALSSAAPEWKGRNLLAFMEKLEELVGCRSGNPS